MNLKYEPIQNSQGAEAPRIIGWSDKYSVGINLIDTQHRELVSLTNELYRACFTSEAGLGDVFKEAMHRMVEYVKYHFTAEMKLLEKIRFPDCNNHKKQHDELVKKILETVKEFSGGKKFVPNNFVRTLEDWIFGHIAVSDKIYAAFVRDQKKKGLLADIDIN